MKTMRFLKFFVIALLIVITPIETMAISRGPYISPTGLKSHDAAAIQARKKAHVTQAQREAAAKRRIEKIKGQKKTKKTSAKTATVKASMAGMPAPGGTPDYFNAPNWTNSPELRKFVDSLPGLGPTTANNLGQYIPVAFADTAAYPGSDYYEIGLVEYSEKMHSDLPSTKLRGYVQLETPFNAGSSKHIPLKYPSGLPILNTSGSQVYGYDNPHYLGPTIIAQKDKPTRIKFSNFLPTGAGGDLFIPVDTTVMGAGMGPTDMPGMPGMKENYTQNRATLHLHGGLTPWISDGTPHQWTTPAGENTSYPKGVSVQNVPDMPDPGPGSLTFFYSNQQSARLMFYHDHAYGITRLNVYAGEAAGYILQDPIEQSLVASGALPADQIPLIIQDKTFVDAAKIASTDPTWNWGSMPPMPMTGDLWFPHVYMPNQNPNDPLGINAFGRWDYGPWFWPPVTTSSGLLHPSVFDPVTGIESPGVPNVSMTMEAFMDTPVVNGTAYPYANVQPKAYRLRILNAANDRFWNLQLYVADPAVTTADNRHNTEVKMIPATPGAIIPPYWPVMDYRAGGVPDPVMAGPSMIQIGTEGGFLPAPAVIPSTPIGYDKDTRSITVGNIKEHGLLLGPAERGDVVVDFSAFAGKTLILYSDAPAPAPAGDPRLDYYTGDADLTTTGGATSTRPGFGPNTRTIMQFRVAAGTPVPFNQTKLNTDLPKAFASSVDPIVVPETVYDSAYGATFSNKYSKIADNFLSFVPAGATATITIPFQSKAIQELFELDYGRMNSTLGVEMPLTNFNTQTTIPFGYIDPVTENINDSITAISPVAGDGTQIWKITHNGVDTHAIHFHLFNVQLINRVDWAGVIKAPDPNETGWKETVRMNPLEDVIVALRPIAPQQPFGLPLSIRPLDPTMPIGSTMGFSKVDANNLPINVTNQLTNFGWEYMWHCHLLGHEEMDMMRPIKFNVNSTLPTTPALNASQVGNGVALTWSDATPPSNPGTLGNPANEVGFKIERAPVTAGVTGTYSQVGSGLANSTAWNDTPPASGTYSYRVTAFNASGNSVSAPATAAFTLTSTVKAITFQPGWNLVTLPLQPINATNSQPISYTAETFGKLAQADVVTRWFNQQYNSHVVGTPINDFPITIGQGIFVHTTSTVNINVTGTPIAQTTPTISTGWNAIGWNDSVSTNANTLGFNIGADMLAKFSNTLQSWVSHITNLPVNNFTISQGEGVFAHKP
jgi:FtsP/CotA-like multicopper oxidase with cupredoxin domain